MYILTNTLLMLLNMSECYYTEEILKNVHSDSAQYLLFLSKHLKPHCKLCEAQLTYQTSPQEHVVPRWLL